MASSGNEMTNRSMQDMKEDVLSAVLRGDYVNAVRVLDFSIDCQKRFELSSYP